MFSMKGSLGLVVFIPHVAFAWFTVSCTTPLVTDRVDPIISPGTSPSNHVHTVHGGSKFGADSTYDALRSSSCTSCLIAQDKSAYYFPKLYFRDPQTLKYEPVPNGSLLVYYLNRGSADVANGGSGLKAFPPGLKMMSGNPNRRAKKFPFVTGVGFTGSQDELRERAIEWSCLRYVNSTATGYDSTTTIGAKGFPTTNCEVGLMAKIHMPACWDGVNLDSDDHVSHVAYLSQLDNGDCPSSHPVTLMKIAYQITWDVQSLASRWDDTKEEWPFVFSNGDPTGYSSHAYFQNGWDTEALQNTIDQCNNPKDDTGGSGDPKACRFLTVGSPDDAMECKAEPTVKDTFDAVLDRLPGCNPLQMGPDGATPYSDSNCPSFAANGSVAAPNGPGGGTGGAGTSVHTINLPVLVVSLFVICSAVLGL